MNANPITASYTGSWSNNKMLVAGKDIRGLPVVATYVATGRESERSSMPETIVTVVRLMYSLEEAVDYVRANRPKRFGA